MGIPTVTILLSGGIDSAATLATYRAHGKAVEALFVAYGQPALRSEWSAAQAIARYYDVTLTKVRLGLRLPSEAGEFFGRNALLALLAAAASKHRPLVIAAGLHSASPYYDTTAAFVGDLQRLLDGYAGGAVSLGVPFLEMPKADVVDFARRHGVPLELTYSCERRCAPACGDCPSCRDRQACHVE